MAPSYDCIGYCCLTLGLRLTAQEGQIQLHYVLVFVVMPVATY